VSLQRSGTTDGSSGTQAGARERRFGHLRGGAIAVVGAVALTMAFMGPSNSTITGTQPMAAGAGYALPLGMVLAALVCFAVASTIAAFSRKLPTAGLAYTFNSHGLGQRAGFLSGWLLLLSYGMVGPLLLAALGGFPAQLVKQELHADIPWWVFSVGFALIVWAIMVMGIQREARTALIFLVLEVVVLTVLSITILAKGGAQGLSLGPFDPSNSLKGLSGLGTGMLWAIISFIGFESAGTLGEETADPRRNVPRALYTAVVVIGLFYVFWAYTASIGFGRSHVAAFTNDSTPWFTMADRYWGAGTSWILLLTVINSLVAGTIAASNAAVRIIFSMGREEILPRALGRVDRRQNPVIAITAFLSLSLVLSLVLGADLGPFGAFAFFGTILGLGICVVYILMNIAVVRFFWRYHRSEFRPLRHAVVPLVASALMLLPIKAQIWPVPPYPNNLAPYIIIAWMVGGAAYFVALARSRPRLVDGLGRVWAEDEPDRAQEIPAGAVQVGAIVGAQPAIEPEVG
jgi:amino acid transporter